MLAAAILTLTLSGCTTTPKKTSESKSSAPVINEAFFIESTTDKWLTYTTYSPDSKPTALTSINIYKNPEEMKTPPYYVYISFTDKDKDIKAFDEVSIPNTGMRGTNKMPSEDSYLIIPVCYATSEIPSTKITNGKYTFKYQAIDSKGNKSEIFPVTVNVSEK